MGIDETLLNEIVSRVLSVARPDRIILFGSAATGQMTKDSDIDLLVIDPAPKNTHDRTVEILDVREWIEKADADLEVARQILPGAVDRLPSRVS